MRYRQIKSLFSVVFVRHYQAVFPSPQSSTYGVDTGPLSEIVYAVLESYHRALALMDHVFLSNPTHSSTLG